MIKQITFAGAAALLVGLAACSPSPNTTTSTDATSTTTTESTPSPTAVDPSMQTQEFANALSMTNMLAVNASKVAQTKAQNAEVKAFAAMMVRDHTGAQAKMATWAAAANMATPTALDAPTQMLSDNITNADAAGFDDKYLDTMIDAHESAISKAESYARDGADPALKQIASDLLPTLRTHFDRAKTIRDAVNRT